MTSPVVHWEIGARDAGKLGTFYQDLFDWQITPAGPDYSLVAGADGGIDGGILQTTGEVPSYLAFYVQVEDLESSLRHAVELGASAVVLPKTIPGIGRFAMIEDPEAHHVGLLEAACPELGRAPTDEEE